MKAKTVTTMIVLAAALGAAGYWLGDRHGNGNAATNAKPEAGGRKILYWRDPMYPQHRFEKPGKSPFMNMDLVPVYADEAGEEKGGVSVSPRVAQNLGLRTALAEPAEFANELRTVGYVRADERRIVQVQSRLAGFVERLAVRAVNDPVRRNEVLAEVYSPEWYGLQQEYLLARQLARANPADKALAQAARERLALSGLSEEEIRRVEAGAKPVRRFALRAPIDGIVSELAVREGQAISVGMPIFTLVDLSGVWITVEVPESQSAFLAEGVHARASLAPLPGRAFEGRIDYIYPELNAQTRTVRARVTLANPERLLKPGMFAEVALSTAPRKALAVPSEAIIRTGTRSVAILAEEGGRFRPAAIETGAESEGHTEILRGLSAGERVVVSGQFLIDSEASLRGALARIEAGREPASATDTHRGQGKVAALDAAKARIELEHDPIASLKWPAMTMEFVVENAAQLAALKPGDAVDFEIGGTANKEGDFVIRRIARRAEAPAAAHGSHK